MKITLKTKPLLAVIQTLAKVIPSRAVQPILENVLVVAGPDGVAITASDLETSIVTVLRTGEDGTVSVQEEGAIAIPARFLLDIIRQVEDETLAITGGEKSAEIAWGAGRSSIPLFDPQDYPAVNLSVKDGTSFDIGIRELLDAVNATLYAVGNDEIRPALCGILFDATPEGLYLVSSDSHRLAIRSIPSVTVPEAASFILHGRNAAMLKGLLEGEGTVKVTFSQDGATFLAGDTTLRVRPITNRFPRWRDVLPKDNPNILVTEPKALASVVRRVSVCANKMSNQIKIAFETNALGSTMEVSAQDLGYSTSAVETVPADYRGDNLAVGFKAQFLLEMLTPFGTENIRISFLDGRHAVMAEPEQKPEGSYSSAILMPIATA